MTCPNCRQPMPVPASGVTNLKSDFRINQLLMIMDEHRVQATKPASEESNSWSLTPPRKLPYCTAHDGKELEFFCEACEELICYKCALKGGKHQSHDYAELSEDQIKTAQAKFCRCDPSQCIIKGLKRAEVGKKFTAILQVIDFMGKPCDELMRSIECELVSEMRDRRVKGNSERIGRSQYEISYQPTIKGRHQLHITIGGQHIKGSPFSVGTKSQELGDPIGTIRDVSGPDSVAINCRGEILVTERGKHCVSVFSPSGERIRFIGTQGSDEGQFNVPYGVTLDAGGNILVADHSNRSIQKFTAEGQFLTRKTGLQKPDDIALNPINNNLYVVGGGNCVQVFNSDLTFLSTFGQYGSGIGEFSYPRGIACSSTGRVYVADSGNDRIQVFTAKGEFLNKFNKRGKENRDLLSPFSIKLDCNDIVYVCEYGNACISLFTSEGQFLLSFGIKYLFCPRGLAVDENGVVYVCNAGYASIEVF